MGDVKDAVAPYTGAWIEIKSEVLRKNISTVAPYTGAWIEMHYGRCKSFDFRVAPYTGAWIEIMQWRASGMAHTSRSLHGSVD